MTAEILRIRIHGRGGQGIKTASRVLGSALFAEGFQVQDAPRYGAERRGAPIFAYVRASHAPVHERGIIREPDLVVVADDSLVQVPAAGVPLGLSPHTVVLIRSREPAEAWKARIRIPGPTYTLDPGPSLGRAGERLVGMQCAGAAARLLGIPRDTLRAAIGDELAGGTEELLDLNLEQALGAHDALAGAEGVVSAGRADNASEYHAPDWVTLERESAERSAPSIHAAGTSAQVRTGLWRTMRPVIDHARCHRCNWMCALPCPDSAITVDGDGYPHVDLDHCKGCLICVAQCPFHVIDAVPEAGQPGAEEAHAGPPEAEVDP